MTGASGCRRKRATSGRPDQIPEAERDYYLERRYPSFGNLVPRDVASRNAKAVCDEGRGVGETGLGVYLDFAMPSSGWARRRFESATATCSTCTSASRMKTPTRFRCASIPAIHYTMGGLWVDYNLMSTIPGLFVIGEANFSDHGANRLGASALMQGLSRRLLRDAVHGGRLPCDEQAGEGAKRRIRRFAARVSGVQRDDEEAAGDQGQADGGFVPSRIGQDRVGLLRDVAHGRRFENAIGQIRELREEFWRERECAGQRARI